VQLSEGVLHFRFQARGTETERFAVPGPALLPPFLRLRDAPDAAVHRFAANRGALTLCPHGMPLDLCEEGECVPFVSDWWAEPRERTEDWRAWSRRFAAILDLGRRVEDPEPLDRETVADAFDWTRWRRPALDVLVPPRREVEVVDKSTGQREVPRRWQPPSLPVRRSYLARVLNRLLLGSRIRREVVVVRDRLALVDGSRYLFGALVQQLAAEVAEVRSIAICDECGQGFRADRRTARYCPRCRGLGVPLKRAQQARRNRLRDRGRTSRNTRPRRPTFRV